MRKTNTLTNKIIYKTFPALALAILILTGLSSCSEGDLAPMLEEAGEVAEEVIREQSRTNPDNPFGITTAPETGNTPEVTSPAPGAEEALRVLQTLRVAQESTMEGYSREKYPHWAADADTYGWEEPDGSCDVRDAALIRDGDGIRIDSECRIYAGSWTDPYTTNVYTDPQDLDGEHLVPLAESWRSGASSWTTKDRETFANAPGVVLAVDDGANQEKGDKGPEAWMPPNRGYWCEYATRWVEIKAVWNLSADPEEKAALKKILSYCT